MGFKWSDVQIVSPRQKAVHLYGWIAFFVAKRWRWTRFSALFWMCWALDTCAGGRRHGGVPPKGPAQFAVRLLSNSKPAPWVTCTWTRALLYSRYRLGGHSPGPALGCYSTAGAFSLMGPVYRVTRGVSICGGRDHGLERLPLSMVRRPALVTALCHWEPGPTPAGRRG